MCDCFPTLFDDSVSVIGSVGCKGMVCVIRTRFEVVLVLVFREEHFVFAVGGCLKT